MIMSKGKRLRNLRKGNSNTVMNKKSMEDFHLADEKIMEKTTILPDGTWKRKDGSDGGGAVRLEFPDGRKYEGGLKDLKPHGKGTETSKDGSKYEGDYVNGVRHGHGKLTLSDGGVIESEWVNGVVEGKGWFQLPKIGNFIGEFEDGEPKRGKLLSPNGQMYEGSFLNWEPHGSGSQIFPDGERYDGDWVNGKYQGFGVYFHKDGKSSMGDWKDNKPSKEGMMIYWESSSFLYEDSSEPTPDSCLVQKNGGDLLRVSGFSKPEKMSPLKKKGLDILRVKFKESRLKLKENRL